MALLTKLKNFFDIKLPYDHNNGGGSLFHLADENYKRYYFCNIILKASNFRNITLTFFNNSMGCGTLSMCGNNYLREEHKDQFLKLCAMLHYDGEVGAIQCVLGEEYYNDAGEQTMLNFGFKEIAEYKNPMHPGSTQKLYLKILDNDLKQYYENISN